MWRQRSLLPAEAEAEAVAETVAAAEAEPLNEMAAQSTREIEGESEWERDVWWAVTSPNERGTKWKMKHEN